MKHWLVVLAATLIAGCCHLPANGRPRPAAALSAELQAEFAPLPPPAALRSELEPHHRYSIQHVALQIAAPHGQTNRTVALEYYRLRNEGRHPVIMILMTTSDNAQPPSRGAVW